MEKEIIKILTHRYGTNLLPHRNATDEILALIDKHVEKQLFLHGVSNWVDSDSLPKHLEKVLVFGKLEPWSENELHTAVLNKAGGLNHWYTGGTKMHEVSKWKNIIAPPCY